MSISLSRSNLETAPSDVTLGAAEVGQGQQQLELIPGDLKVDVYADPAGADGPWAELEEIAPASLYQTRRFLLPWIETIGAARSITPMIVVASTSDGIPLALFPLGVRKTGPIHIAEFLGGRDSNAGLALFHPGLNSTSAGILSLLQQAALNANIPPDLLVLQNQPMAWDGQRNFLSQLPHRSSPSQLHACILAGSGEDYRKEQLSKDYRKKLRAKQRKLEELGAFSIVKAKTRQQAEIILDAFYQQKLQRFDDKNITSDFDTAASRAFFTRCCLTDIEKSDPAIELHALKCGEKIVATFGGGIHQGRYHGMFNSFDAGPQFAKFSPGDILLSHLIDEKTKQGLRTFDLGIGESRYKQIWCNTSQPLFDTILAMNSKGRAAATWYGIRQTVKRSVKQSSWAWPLALKLRTILKSK